MFEHPFLEYLPLYTMGALTREEQGLLEEHLRTGCELCQLELNAFQETAAHLPFGLPTHPMPSQLKERIRGRLEMEGLTRPRTLYWRFVVAAAILAFFLINGALFWMQNLQLIKKDKEIAKIQKVLEQQEKEIEWLRDPSVQLAMLTGMAPTPQAKGKMVWNPTVSKGIFYVSFLPKLTREQSYQLWLIGKKGPVSAAVFDSDERGNAVVTISRVEGAPEGVVQFAVTIEPRGGVPQPTGSMVLAGQPL